MPAWLKNIEIYYTTKLVDVDIRKKRKQKQMANVENDDDNDEKKGKRELSNISDHCDLDF